MDAVTRAVERGDADLAFGLDYPDAPVPRAPGVELVRVATERFALAVPGAWDMPEAISLADVAGRDWILPPAETNYGRAVRAACRRAEFEPRVMHLVTDTAVSLAMVAQGLGITMVTDMMLALAPPALRTLRVREDVRRHVVLARRHGDESRPAVQAMTAVIDETVRAAVASAHATETPTADFSAAMIR